MVSELGKVTEMLAIVLARAQLGKKLADIEMNLIGDAKEIAARVSTSIVENSKEMN